MNPKTASNPHRPRLLFANPNQFQKLFSNIKPAKNGTLTDLIFTPDDPNGYSDFNFRGQLLASALGTVTVIVTDNQSNTPQTFVFTGLGANADFSRIGVISNDGETIKSIELIAAGDGFKEVKQIRISGFLLLYRTAAQR
jgi:hypothetical protein